MKASDVMTADVVTVTPESTVEEVARLLVDKRISAVPVVDATGRLIGIASEGDLMRRAESGTERPVSWWLELLDSRKGQAQDYVRAHARRIADVMTAHVESVAPDTDIADIAALLERKGIKRVPVLSGGKVVGIVSRANLLHGLAAARQPAAPAAAVDDSALRERILDKLKGESWSPALMNVTVSGGVVDLWGMVHSDAERRATRIAVEAVDGVRGVNDNLWMAPATAYAG